MGGHTASTFWTWIRKRVCCGRWMKPKSGTGTTLRKIRRWPRNCGRRFIRDSPISCKNREPTLSESDCWRLAPTAPKLGPDADSDAAVADSGARLAVLDAGGIAADGLARAAGQGKFPGRSCSTWVLAFGHHSAA